jgi:DNA-binding NarL/FixJ family response regulator
MKVVIIDDHPLVRRGIDSLLSFDTEIQIAGEAGCVGEGVEVIEKNHPDIVIVDLRLGSESGLEIVRRVKGKDIRCKFIVLTSSVEAADFRNAEELGVEGYILKEALPEEIIFAVKLISKGRKYVDPNIINLITIKDKDQPEEKLTEREVDVLNSHFHLRHSFRSGK